MKENRFRLKGQLYNISCVLYEPSFEKADFAVVCLHGFGGDKESSAVKRLADGITENGGAVIAFDFPAHGESEAGDDMLTVENCVEDAKTAYAYAEKEYGRADFFATSFGAYVLINMLKTVDLKGSKAILRSPAVKMENTFLCSICNLAPAELESVDFIECGFGRKMKLGYNFWLDLKKHNIDDAFFENDTLMIFGDRDDVVNPEDMERFAHERDNIKVKIIRGADHRYKEKGQLDEAIFAAIDFLTK